MNVIPRTTSRFPVYAVLAAVCLGSGWAVAGPQDPGHYAATTSRYEQVGRNLRRSVTWLAHDERGGRRAGTPGELETVQWLAARLGQYQLTPAGEDGYLQPFEVPLPEVDSGTSWVELDERVSGADNLVPLSCSKAGKAQGPLAYRGFGIVHAEREWNDYPGELPEGAIVLILEGEPESAAQMPAAKADGGDHGAAPHGGGPTVVPSASFGVHASPFHKVMNAARLGAAAVLLAPDPNLSAEESTAGLAPFRGGLLAPIPALRISKALAKRLIPDFDSRAAAAMRSESGDSLAGAEAPASERSVSLFAGVERRRGLAYNVLARLEGGEGPTVVVGAHLDHLGRGGSGSLERGSTEIHNGADDNASGVAAILELAYQLLNAGVPVGDVVLAFWSGEELGLLGSSHWAERPTVPLEEIAAYINLDMVGHVADGERSVLQVLAAGSSPAFAGWMDEAGAAAGLELDVDLSLSGVGGSDHQTFLRNGIPALHLFSGLHGDYHRPGDDAETLDYPGIARVVDLTADFIRRIQATEELPFTQLKEAEGRSSRGWSVSFGSVPDYTFEGPGLLLSGTSPASPAEEAGLLAGDVVRQVGDVEIVDIHSFVYMLQLYKPGDVVLTRFLRDGLEMTARVTLRTRAPR